MIPATELLPFESRGWIHAGPKEQAIRTDLGLSPTRYYLLLTKAMNGPAEVAEYPATAARRLLNNRSCWAGRWVGHGNRGRR